MTDDYTKEIRERLDAASPASVWKELTHLWSAIMNEHEPVGPSTKCEQQALDNQRFINHSVYDIANLLAEREVLREALSKIKENWEHGFKNQDAYGNGPKKYGPDHEIAKTALAWKPGK